MLSTRDLISCLGRGSDDRIAFRFVVALPLIKAELHDFNDGD
jgi:hypothetical protein